MASRKTDWPDGIAREHYHGRAGWHKHASPLRLGLLSLPLVFAFAGLTGREETQSISGEGVEVSWHAPAVIRNGELFEMRLGVRAEAALGDLRIGVPAALWEDMTINTVIPAASEESSEDGELRFDFGPLAAGSAFLLKVDGQINPDILGGNAGTIRVYDGEQVLAQLPARIVVLP